MKFTTLGIVLQKTDHTDHAMVVRMLTPEQGILSFLSRSSKTRKGNIKRSIFQSLTVLEVTLTGKASNGLYTATEIVIPDPQIGIQTDIIRSAQAMFMAELILKTIHGHPEDPTLFQYCLRGVQELNTCESTDSSFHLVFAMGLSIQLGFSPSTLYSEGHHFNLLTGNYQAQENQDHCLDAVLSAKWHELVAAADGQRMFHCDRQDRIILLRCLMSYYRLHEVLHAPLKSPEVLSAVFD